MVEAVQSRSRSSCLAWWSNVLAFPKGRECRRLVS
jgi:hypothetical protein